MSHAVVSPIREPLVTGNKTYHQITEDLCRPTETAPSLAWVAAFVTALIFMTGGVFCILWTIWFGIGSWNLNRTVGWGWDITNFCLLYTSPSPRDRTRSRMPSSA